jgi:hypothetical protein
MSAEILPDSRVSTVFTPKGAVMGAMGWEVPIYCGSCGCEAGRVPQENMTFVFWLCNSCFATHGEITNTMVMPDEVYWEEVKQAQLAKYGHSLNAEETLASLANPDSLESLLARSREAMTPHATQ